MKYVLASILALFLSGCLVTQVAPKTEYRIDVKPLENSYTAKGCKNNSLKIAKAFGPSYLMTKKMNYVSGPLKQNEYASSLWSVSPINFISQEFVEHIRDTKIFKSVHSSKSRSRNDYILEVNVEDFLQYFDKEITSSHVNVTMSVTLLDMKGKIISNETFTTKVDKLSLNADGGVHGLNQALKDILIQNNEWLNGVCQ